jgi:uncharacterized protein involved in exopolysaccharide biosynthesis
MMDNIGTRKLANYDTRLLTLRDMLRPLFRNGPVVIVMFCSIFAIAIVLAWGWANHYYVATMQVVVSGGRSDPTITGQQNAALVNQREVTVDEVVSEIALLQGRDMLQEVVGICKLTRQQPSLLNFWKTPDSQDSEFKNPKVLESATKNLAAQLRVAAEKTSHVINLTYGHAGAPEIPACVLQTLGKLYLEKHLRLQRPVGTFNFFAGETQKYQQALADSENRLANFSQSEGLAAPEILRTDMAQQLVAAQASLYQARQMIAAHQQRLESLKNQMKGTPSRSSTAETSLAANTLLQQLQSSLLASQIKKTQLLVKYDPTYPLVEEVDAEIAQTKEAIAEAEKAKYLNTTTDRDSTFEYLRQDRAKTEADLASEQATAAALLKTIQGMQSELVSLDVKALQHGALLRETKANEDNYLLYLTKREQERTSDALDEKRIANVAIAVPANVPALPAHSPFSIMLAGFFLAVLGGVVAGYLADFMDPSFRTPDELEEMLKINVLAAVPRQAA